MKAYRIDEYLGAATEIKALFFDMESVNEFLRNATDPHNIECTEIEVSEEFFYELYK